MRALILMLLLAVGAAYGAERPAVGSVAPDFRLQDQNGEWRELSDFRGKWLAIYFYPKNDTPGCTTEACNFRDNFYVFRRIGADVVGISLDDVASHKEFAEKYSLPFTLLADVDGRAVDAYGVRGKFLLMDIAKRETFLVDPEGKIAKHYADVDPETHTDQVIADLKSLMGGDDDLTGAP